MTVPTPVFNVIAVKLTGVPAQIGPAGEEVKLTIGVKRGITSTVILFESAEFEVRHVSPARVIRQVTTSPLARLFEVNVFDALLCTLFPLTMKL